MTTQNPIEVWCQDHSTLNHNQFVDQLKEFLSDEQIVRILTILDRTCLHCFNGRAECGCWD